jgi:AcrR family transcriptional regulator
MDQQKRTKSLRIAKVAARLFNSKGFLKTSMKDIAAASKISKGGIYHYFSSKDDILYFVLSNYMDKVMENLEEELEMIEDSSSRIRFIISRHTNLYVQNLSESKTLLHEVNCLSKRTFQIIAEKETTYFEIVSKVVSELFEERLTQDRLKIITFLLFGMCNWTYSWYDPKGNVKSEELSDLIYAIFMKGLSGLTRINLSGQNGDNFK